MPLTTDLTWHSTMSAGRALGVSDDFIRARIADGTLRATAIRSGRRVIYRIRPSDLDEFRHHHTGSPADPRFGG